MSKIDTSKYNQTFIDEAKEQLTEMNNLLLVLEKSPGDVEALNDFFRYVHTLKGTSAILGHNRISDLSHLIEDLLDKLRSKEMPFNQDLMDLLFDGVDTLEAMIGEVTKDKKTIDGHDTIEKLKTVLSKEGDKAEKKVVEEVIQFTVNEIISDLNTNEKKKIETLLKDKSNIFVATIIFEDKCKLIEARAFQIFRNLNEVGTVISTNPDMELLGEHEDLKTIQMLVASPKKRGIVDDIIHQTPEVKTVDFDQITTLSDHGNNTRKGEGKSILGTIETIRVNVKLLDSLLDLVGEIMINNIRVNQIGTELKEKNLKNALKTTNLLTEELQHYVLQMRMVPIDQIFRRFPRMVRDMAKLEGKEINFSIEGKDIEIDRSLIDEIGDSLLHLLRNSVDHGIESPEGRKKGNKDTIGTVKLSAHREQSYIVIEVTDDGKGIDVDKLTAAAVKKGIKTEREIEEMKSDDKLDLIFLPGVTTAEKITEVSGRGVGLDVVYNKIKSLGGSVIIDSGVGKGTKMTIRLPPTMSIIKALLVKVGEERYALPLENVSETLRVPQNQIHTIRGIGMFNFRNEVLPMYDLNREFGSAPTSDAAGLATVIMVKDESRVGLIVDNFLEQQEIVVKTVANQLRKSKYFSGATILGDGSVAMIIDVGAFI